MFHKEVLDDIEFVIIDNNPESSHGKHNSDLMGHIMEPKQYIKFPENNGTSQSRNKVFEYANTPYVMCIDSHVMIQPKALKKLIAFYDSGRDEGNLLQGPLIYDDLKNISTHFDLKWRDSMWGTWGTDERGISIESPPFEIPSQGLGLFTCRKDSWLGFNKLFSGFGGEEGYIHEKYRKNGKKALCLPFLRWLHRFGRPDGVPYPLTLDDRIRNYFIGHLELGMDPKIVLDHFKDKMSTEKLNEIYINALKQMALNNRGE
jgi:glycosyltransferase involved in cell wall biosynthesis